MPERQGATSTARTRSAAQRYSPPPASERREAAQVFVGLGPDILEGEIPDVEHSGDGGLGGDGGEGVMDIERKEVRLTERGLVDRVRLTERG